MYLITDVDNVFLNYQEKDQITISEISGSKISQFLKDGHFQEGSMAPKIRAALYFLRYHGKKVIITSIDKLKDAIHNQAGTIIRDD